jgi:hypothetical protein
MFATRESIKNEATRRLKVVVSNSSPRLDGVIEKKQRNRTGKVDTLRRCGLTALRCGQFCPLPEEVTVQSSS